MAAAASTDVATAEYERMQFWIDANAVDPTRRRVDRRLRAIDLAHRVDDPLRVLAGHPPDRRRTARHERPPDPLPRGARGQGRTGLHDDQVPDAAGRRRATAATLTGPRADLRSASARPCASAGCCASASSTSCRSSGTCCAGTCRSSGRARCDRCFFEELTRDIPQYWQRLVVRPGLTGLAQLRMTRDMSWDEKLAHDLEWIADRSVSLYLRIAAATVVRIARGSPLAGRPRPVEQRALSRCAGSAASWPPGKASPSTCAPCARCAGRSSTGAPTRTASTSWAASGWRCSASRSSTSPGGEQPIGNEDGTVQRRPERRDLQPRGSCAPGSLGAGTGSRRRSDTEVLVAPLRGARARLLSSGCGGCSRSRSGTRDERRPRAGARPLRDQAALLPARRRTARLRLGARERCPRTGRSGARSTPTRSAPTWRSTASPAPHSIFAGVREAARRAPARLRRRRAPQVARYARPAPAELGALRTEPCRQLADELRAPAARLRPCAPDRRRAGRRAALGRRGLGRAHGARRAGVRRADQHVLDRVRGGVVQRAARARLVAQRYGTDHSRARRDGPTPSRCSDDRRRLRRAVRRLVGRADVPRLRGWRPSTSRWCSRARAATSCSAATTPTSPTCWRSAPRGSAGLAAPFAERLPSSSRKASFDYRREAVRALGCPAAARAPSRLEGDLLGRRRAELTGDRGRRRRRPARSAAAPLPRRRRERRRSHGCRTSMPASTSSTTCW